jgi:CHAT domain-containing protein/Flp pilus assembly protein TadD
MKTVYKYMTKTASIAVFVLFGICARAQDINVIIKQADSLNKAKNYTDAIALLERYIKLFETKMPEVWSRLGDNYYNLKEYEKAKTYYLKYYDYEKSRSGGIPEYSVNMFVNNLLSLMRTYAKLSDYHSAIRVCKESIELIERYKEYYHSRFWNYSSKLAEKYGSLSGLYLYTKDYQLSEQAVQKTLSTDSTKTWVKINLAHALQFQGKTQEAETIYNELAPTYASTFLDNFEQLEKVQAIPQNMEKDVERIKNYMRNIVSVNVIMNQADSLSKVKNYTDAIALLEKNIKLFEIDSMHYFPLVYNRLGNNYYDSEDYKRSKAYYLKYYDFRKPDVENNPTQYSVYWFVNNLSSLIRTYNKLSDYQAAIRVCKESIELIERHKEHFKNYSSDLARKYGSLSWYYLLIKDYRQAEQAVRKGLDINGKEVWIKTNLAHALLFQRKTQEAEEIYNELAQTIYHNNETYVSTLLEDLELFEKAKVIPQNVKRDVERIKIELNDINTAINLKDYRLSSKSDVTATISGDTLIIGGTGKMEDYIYTNPPWYSRRNSIKKVIIQQGVTSIGEYAFSKCSKLSSVTIPNSVTSIGACAFLHCRYLSSITIPNNVTSIADGVFAGCEYLFSITIPDSVTSIGENAFSGCHNLTSITIPNNVKRIGAGAFGSCRNLKTVTIPDGITSIEYWTFAHCENLSSVTIPNSVTKIGERAFYNCKNLSSVSIPESVTSIGDYAFIGCERFHATVSNNITNIGEKAFEYWPFNRDNPRYPFIDGMFCRGDTLILFRGYGAVTIPNGITCIGKNAFSDCIRLTSVTIPNSVVSIEDDAFSGCHGLTSVIIPNSVTKIGNNAFYRCYNLTSVSIPNSVTKIGARAFYQCHHLTSITIPESVTSIENGAFGGSGLVSIIIPNSVTKIGANVFSGEFTNCNNLKEINVSTDNQCYSSIDGVLYDKKQTVLIKCPVQKTGMFTIPNGITKIEANAFSYCEKLTSIIIPNSVTKIEANAFSYCKKLTSITIPNGVTSIEGKTFYECTRLKVVIIPASVTSIGWNAFNGCSLTSVINLNSALHDIDISNVFDEYYLHNTTLYVPASSVSLYKNTDIWEDFIIQPVWNISEMFLLQIQKTDSILQQASILRKEKKYKESIALLLRNKNSFAHIDRLPILYDSLSYHYLFVKDFKQSENFAQKALSIDSTCVWIKKNLAHALFLQGKYKSAKSIYQQLSRTFYAHRITYSQMLLDDFETLENEGLINKMYMSEMEKIRTELLSIREIEQTWTKAKKTSADYSYRDEEVIDLLVHIQSRLDENLPFSANALLHLGEVYYARAIYSEYSTGDYLKAENCFLKAKDIIEQTKGKQNKDYFTALSWLIKCAGAYVLGEHIIQRQDNYTDIDKGIRYYIEKKDIEKNIFMGRNVDYYLTIKKLGILYSRKGDYKNALHIELEKIGLIKKTAPAYYEQLCIIGELYEKTGDYSNAEKYYLEAKNIREEEGDKNSKYALLLNNLGVFYMNLGDYSNAEKYCLEAKNVFEKNRDRGTSDYANTLKSLGALYSMQNVYDKAETYLLKATNILKQQRRDEPSAYALSLGDLGNLYCTMAEYSKAETYYLEQKEILEKVVSKEHSDYAFSLVGLGNLYGKSGDYAKAEEFYLEAISILGKVISKEHPDYIESVRNLCYHYQNMKEYEKATKFEKTVCEQTINLTKQNFSFLSEQQRNLYWKTQSSSFEGSYSLSWFYPDVSANSLNYNNTLFTKGILLRTNNQIRSAVYNSGNQQLIQQFEELGSLRQQIIVLQSRDSLDLEYVESLSSRADSLDKVLTIASQSYKDLKSDISMTWQDVQRRLKPDDVAIEFVHFRLYDRKWTDSTLYAALVLRPGAQSPVWIPLCEQKQLQSVLATTTHDTQEQTETLYSGRGAQLYQLVWQSLEKELPNVKNVYYSPSGLLHKIAFNALPTDKDGVLLSDKYNLHLLSSTREIARLKQETAAAVIRDTTVVYGGLAYDARQSSMLAAAKPYKGKQKSGDSRFVDRFRKRELPNVELRSGFSEWQYLDGAKTETEQIVISLDSKRIPYQYYTENKGNEESFKYLSGTQTGVIHLATHGFFLPDVENKAVDEIVQRLGGSKDKPLENPLLRSGLIMSGANNQWLAREYVMEEDIEDGILTADEISRLNLTKTKLVVLSACETGLGDVKNSEGVFGLQRAFKLAGVESLIMSLWKVPDDATAELMTTFYNEWLAGDTKQNAFKTAQQKVRAKYKSPYYWAAFVMMD